MSAADKMCHGVIEDTEEDKIHLKLAPLPDFISFMHNMVENLSPNQRMILYSFISDSLEKAIDYLSRECLQEHKKSFEKMGLNCFSVCNKDKLVLKNRLEILTQQGLHFEQYVDRLKSEKAKRIYTLKPMDAQCLCEEILHEVNFECNLLRKAPFIYAYKKELLTSIEQNQITIVSADACYSPSEAIPFFLHQAYPNDVILSCEPNADAAVLLSEKCRTFENSDLTNFVGCEVDGRIGKKTNDTNIIFTSVSELYRKSTVSHYFTNCKVIIHCDLGRSFETDVVLEQLRNSLRENNTLKTILLLSPLDDSSKFVSYFSSFTVHSLVFPNITFAVQTVWLTDSVSVDEFNSAGIINTALAIHALNEPGNVLMVLPEPHTVRTVTLRLSQKFAHWAYFDAVCIPVPEDPSEQTMLDFSEPNENPLKRKFYLTTMRLAALFDFPNVSYVIDSGIYINANPLNFTITGHPHTMISKQKAKQLKKLAGHCRKGICYRLYSKQDYLNKMTEKEMPEVLYKNPHEIMARIYEHSSGEVMAMDFVQNLCTKKKEKILMMLRKADAIKGNQLTSIGEQIVKLQFSPSYSKLIVLGIQRDFGYEAIVLVAFLLLNKSVFIDHAGNKDMQKLVELSKLRYKLYDSDLFTFLNIYQEFSSLTVYDDSWCKMQGLDCNVLWLVRENVTRINNHVCQTMKKDIYPKMRLNGESDWFALRELLLNCFADNLCVYTGHHSYGYHFLSANCLTSLDSSSVLQKRHLPEFVIFGDFKNASESVIMGITSIPRELVLSAMKTHLSLFQETQLLGQKLEPVVIENIGIALMKQTFIGKDGERLLELKNRIEKVTKCDLIVIEPSVENCSVTLYAPSESINMVERMIHKILKTELNSLLNRREESIVKLKKGEFSLPIYFIWEKGGVTSRLGHSHYEAKPPALSESKSNLSHLHSPTSIKGSIKLKFFRRLGKGYGYVSFNNENFVVAKHLTLLTIEINGKEVKIEAHHATNQLCISCLPSCITSRGLKDAVEAALEKLFSATIKVKSATVAYQEPYETTDKEIDLLKGKIHKNYCRLFGTSDISVVVPKPQNTALYMEAFITVNELDVLVKEHAQLLNSFLKIDGLPVKAETCYSSAITCSKTIYEHLKKEIIINLEELQEMGHFGSSIVDTNVSYPGLIELNLFSETKNKLVNFQFIIQNLLEGKKVTCRHHKNLHKLFTHEGHSWLRALEQQIDIHIIDNYESTVLQLYGTRAKCYIATQQIIKYLDNSEKEVIKKVHFSNGNSAELVLKAVLKIYGADLKSFIENFKLSTADIDFQETDIILRGDRQNIENVRNCLYFMHIHSDLTCHEFIRERFLNAIQWIFKRNSQPLRIMFESS